MMVTHDEVPWCKGCGFANYSTGPCEICGTDPETGEVDQDFLDERETDRANDDHS
jgi:hypothetical protein